MNFRTGVYHGKPVLTWWEGKATSGLGTGTHVILDDSYRVIARVPAGGGRQSDLHEFLITPAEHRAPHELRGPRRRPDLGRRPAERQGDRRDGAGDRAAERPRAVRVEEPRPRRHRRDARAVCMGHPLDYFHINSIDLTSGRRAARLGAQHVGRLQDQPPHRRSALAPRRQAQRLQDGQGNRVRVAARRAPPGTQPHHDLRRRRACRRSSRSRAAS